MININVDRKDFSKGMQIAEYGLSEFAQACKAFNLAFAARKNRKPRGMRKFT